MNAGSRRRPPFLTIVGTTPVGSKGASDAEGGGARRPVKLGRNVDWSILMARVQDGDGAAYRRLLDEVMPYLRSLAGRRQSNPADIEDAVQDILLTLHAVRQTYDPTRPFGPWLVAVANRRLVDRLRHQGRLRAREAPLTAGQDAYPAPQASVDDSYDRHGLEAAISNLPSGQRQAIRMLKLKEMSLKEASAASGASMTSLKVATHRGLKALRKLLSHRSEP